MFKPVRVVATIVFLASIGLVFVGAFVLGNAVGILSFEIPFRTMLTSTLRPNPRFSA
jgi:hypothetical protein